MKETPHSAILDRVEPLLVINQHYLKQTEFLRDLADYGSNLVARAFHSSPRKFPEIAVCGVLLKQIVAMIDASEALLSQGCGLAAHLPVRTAFEASLYIDWILKENSDKRALCYLVSNYREERVWVARVTPGTFEETTFSKLSQQLGLDIHSTRPNLANEASEHLKEVEQILAQPELKAIDAEFDHAKKKKGREAKWHQLDGAKSIRDIAKQVDRLAEYEFFYSKGSAVTHTGSYKDHIAFSSNQVRFKPVRHIADINFLVTFIGLVGIGTYQKILTKYRPAELKSFGQKYLDDWRQPFQNIKPIHYEF